MRANLLQALVRKTRAKRIKLAHLEGSTERERRTPAAEERR